MTHSVHSPAKILVIDDDEMVRLTCRHILKNAPYEMIEAVNGVEGVALYDEHRPGIVIVDVLMPEKEGLETIVEMRERRWPVKIIAMSCGGATQNMAFLQIAQRLGADRLLAKPLTAESLRGCIKSLGESV